MRGIEINILPREERALEKERSKKALVIRSTIAVIALAILITTAAFAVKILKNNEQVQTNEDLSQLTSQLSAYREQEGYLTILKKRLTTINNFNSQQSSELAALNIIFNLLPNNVVISSLSSTKKDVVLITGIATDTTSLQSVINSLTDPAINKQKISKVTFENLSQDSTGRFRFDITTIVKQ